MHRSRTASPCPGIDRRPHHAGSRALPVCLLGLLLAVAAAAAVAQPDYHETTELPEGAIGERIQQVLAAVNHAEPEARRKATAELVAGSFAPMMRDAVPLERHLGVFDDLYRRSEGLEFYGIRHYDDPASAGPGTTVILKNRLTESWQALVLVLEEEEPHRIAGLNFLPARPPAGLPTPPPLPADRLEPELDAFLERLTDADLFSGTVLLARGDQVLYQAAAGEASKRFGALNLLDTRFNLGSMNKMFTAVAIVQLAEEGKLALTDPLSKYLDDSWLPAEITEKVTIEHLLTHTSGLGSYFNQTFIESSRDRFREVDDYKPLVEGETLAHEPGTAWRYSNTGFLLLGAVIEAVTGESYFDVVRQRIYQPAGMVASDSYDMDEPVPNLAIGYLRQGDRWSNNLYLHVIRGGPAGGGFATAPDLHRFARALTGGKLLPAAAVERLTSAKPELSSHGYGYGFSIEGTPDDRIVGHGGGFAGISSNLDIYLDSGYVAVVLSNYSGGATPVQQRIRELIARIEQ